MHHGPQRRDMGRGGIKKVCQVTACCKQFRLSSKLASYTNEGPLRFWHLMHWADLEHLIQDLEQMIEVEPLENNLFRSAKAPARYISAKADSGDACNHLPGSIGNQYCMCRSNC
jgi:hypothetical protein